MTFASFANMHKIENRVRVILLTMLDIHDIWLHTLTSAGHENTLSFEVDVHDRRSWPIVNRIIYTTTRELYIVYLRSLTRSSSALLPQRCVRVACDEVNESELVGTQLRDRCARYTSIKLSACATHSLCRCIASFLLFEIPECLFVEQRQV